MLTPDALVGTKNPWTDKPFGREIKLGLKTRSHAEAVRLRDVRMGFRRLSVRPQHPKSEPLAQEAFKKTSPPR